MRIDSTGRSQKKVILPDSTEVSMNYHSRFEYDTNRNVSGVKGEIYFKVKQGKVPFAIYFDGYRITCAGPAEFNVNAFYQNEVVDDPEWSDILSHSVRVTAFKGSVKVWRSWSYTELEHNNPCTINETKSWSGDIDGSKCDSTWTTGWYCYSRISARWITMLCKRLYGITIQLSKGSQNTNFIDVKFSVKAPFAVFLDELTKYNGHIFIKKSQHLYLAVTDKEFESMASTKKK
jgi:hypothetical protein